LHARSARGLAVDTSAPGNIHVAIVTPTAASREAARSLLEDTPEWQNHTGINDQCELPKGALMCRL